MGRTALSKLTTAWKDMLITLPTKVRLLESLVFGVIMYGCESWTINKDSIKRIDSFELWCYRRILRIPWLKKITNFEVLKTVQPKCTLEARVITQQLKYFAHTIRRENSSNDWQKQWD